MLVEPSMWLLRLTSVLVRSPSIAWTQHKGGGLGLPFP